MKIDVIVPSNNIKELNGFISSFDTLTEFKKHANLIIIGNGKVYYDGILGGHNANYDLIRDNNDYSNSIVPFAKLRNLGMKNSRSDFFLFLDDDHRFEKGSDEYLIKCINILKDKDKNISILSTDRFRNEPKEYQLKLKMDGFIWTNRGLFIKNLINEYNFDELIGSGEDLLFSYCVLEKDGFPYELNGSPITRKEKNFINGKLVLKKSYSIEVLEENIIGFIKIKFKDNEWNWVDSYNRKPIEYPNKLNKIISKRIEDKMNESLNNYSNK